MLRRGAELGSELQGGDAAEGGSGEHSLLEQWSQVRLMKVEGGPGGLFQTSPHWKAMARNGWSGLKADSCRQSCLLLEN